MAAQWFYRRAGAEHGPVSSGKIRRMVARGELESTDLLWKKGMEEWRPAGESATLFGRDEARAAKRQRSDPAGKARRRRKAGPVPSAAATPMAWIARRPVLMSLGIGVNAGLVISVVLVTVMFLFSRRAPQDAAVDAPAAKPVAAKPAPQPAAVEPAAPPPAAVEPAAPPAPAVDAVAAVTAPPAPEQPPADPPPPEPQPAGPETEPPAETQASPPKPPPRVRMRLPGEDF